MGTSLNREMQSLAASLSEHPVVMEMFGVGPALGPQLMAEIGDVRRFHSKKALGPVKIYAQNCLQAPAE